MRKFTLLLFDEVLVIENISCVRVSYIVYEDVCAFACLNCLLFRRLLRLFDGEKEQKYWMQPRVTIYQLEKLFFYVYYYCIHYGYKFHANVNRINITWKQAQVMYFSTFNFHFFYSTIVVKSKSFCKQFALQGTRIHSYRWSDNNECA